MPFDIPLGHKFAFITLDNAGIDRNLRGEIHLGGGTWAVFGAPFNLHNHWREWLGSLQVEHLDRASLTIVGSSRVDLQACKLEYSIVSPK